MRELYPYGVGRGSNELTYSYGELVELVTNSLVSVPS